MKEVNLGSATFFISDEVFNQFYDGRTPEERERFQREIVGYLGGNLEKLALAAQVPLGFRNRLKILHAHESVPNKQWLFADDGIEYPVHGWVDSMDGTASVLIIICCNTSNATLTAERSSIIYPKSAYNLYGAMYGEVEFKTSIPH